MVYDIHRFKKHGRDIYVSDYVGIPTNRSGVILRTPGQARNSAGGFKLRICSGICHSRRCPRQFPGGLRFAKIRFPGRNIMFSIILATMMIPEFVTMIPQYVLYAKIGWVGTYLPLIVPQFMGSAYFIFILAAVLCRDSQLGDRIGTDRRSLPFPDLEEYYASHGPSLRL